MSALNKGDKSKKPKKKNDSNSEQDLDNQEDSESIASSHEMIIDEEDK